jgi:hypothetical protein
MTIFSLLLRDGTLPMTGPLDTPEVKQGEAGITLGSDGELVLSEFIRRDPGASPYAGGLFGVSRERPGSVVISDGVHNAFPSLTLAADGDLVVLYRKGANHISSDGLPWFRRSPDGGKTWGAEQATVSATPGLNTNHCALRVLSTGTWVFPIFYYDVPTLQPKTLHVARSTNEGSTWTVHNVPNVFNVAGEAGGVDGVLEMPNGDLLLAIYGKYTADTYQSSHLLKSTDDGVTWTSVGDIARNASRASAEPCLALLEDGTLLCTLRAMGAGWGGVVPDLQEIDYCTSSDDGDTWTAISTAFSGTGAPQLAVMTDGTVICCYRSLRTRSPIGLRSSVDGGASWSSEVTLSDAYGTVSVYGAALERAPGLAWLVWGAQTDDVSDIYLTYLQSTAGRAPDGMETFHDVTAESLRVVGTRGVVVGSADDLQLGTADAQSLVVVAGNNLPPDTPGRTYNIGNTDTNGLEQGSVFFGSLGTPNVSAGITAFCGSDPTFASLGFYARNASGYSPRLFLPNVGGAVVGSATANGNNTKGLTVDMGTATDAVFSLLSTGSVSQPATALASAATFARLSKIYATGGGLSLLAMASSAASLPVALSLVGVHGAAAADATKASTSRALVEVTATLSSGGTTGNVAAGGNVFAVRTKEGGSEVACALFSAGGNQWLRGALTLNGDSTGTAAMVTLVNSFNTAARSTGTGTVKFTDGTSRDSTGSLKVMIGTSAKYLHFFDAP